MDTINHHVVVGFLGQDAQVRYDNAGKSSFPRVRFSLATKESWKNSDGEFQEVTDWHNAIVFGYLAERAVEFRKGDLVRIEGVSRRRTWTAEDGSEKVITEIHVKSLSNYSQLHNKRQQQQPQQQQQQQQQRQQQQPQQPQQQQQQRQQQQPQQPQQQRQQQQQQQQRQQQQPQQPQQQQPAYDF